jgi:hypothetical protein
VSIQAINSVAMFNTSNNNAIDKSGPQAATRSGSTSVGGTATDVVQLSTASKSTSRSDTDKYYDVRDTNKDGIVSAEEELQYALSHPAEEIINQVANTTSKLQAVAQYIQQGNERGSTNMIQGLINISI